MHVIECSQCVAIWDFPGFPGNVENEFRFLEKCFKEYLFLSYCILRNTFVLVHCRYPCLGSSEHD